MPSSVSTPAQVVFPQATRSEVVSQAVAVREQSGHVSTTQGEKEEGYHVYTWTPL
jgi:hypothetical protein